VAAGLARGVGGSVGWASWATGASRGQLGQPGKEGMGLFLFFFPISLSFVLSYSLHDFKSNFLLNECSTKSLIKQNKSML
jgi:hypothetical protein